MKNLIVGFGKTGLSLAQYFSRKNILFDIVEENQNNENIKLYKNSKIIQNITPEQLQAYQEIYLSPGIDPHAELYSKVKNKLSNDLNIFTKNVTKPYIAITGSNGKSTLVHLLEAALRGAGLRAIAIGNNGVAMLDHIDDDVDYFILELSSYQLELAKPFLCEVAYVSNISPDHLERHKTIEKYAAIKERLYQNCRYAVINDDDAICKKMYVSAQRTSRITLAGLGVTGWLPSLKMIGEHNIHNALAVMAICELLNIDRNLALKSVEAFPGLEHRCEFVLEKEGVTWWNDSKGTNIASTITAVNSLRKIVSGKLVMILGGQGKGQDFSELVNFLQDKTRAVILLGECKDELEKLFGRDVGATGGRPPFVVDNLEQAVEVAKKIARTGDAVLLSPACASWDMFKSYEYRGWQFKELVNKLMK